MYYICVHFQDDSSNFTKVRATTDIFPKIQNPIKFQIGHQFAWKSSRLKGRNCITAVPNFKSISQAVFESQWCKKLKVEHIHTHTFGCQLKITFLDVFDYFEYSDTNISKKNSRKLASSVRKQNCHFNFCLRIMRKKNYPKNSMFLKRWIILSQLFYWLIFLNYYFQIGIAMQ